MAYCSIFQREDGDLECSVCHEVYPARPLPFRAECGKTSGGGARQPKVEPGAGTELKNLLLKARVSTKADCGCGQHVAMMDANGIQWCRDNVEQIVTWLVDAAKQRGWKFAPRWGARRLVQRAIKNAEKKSAKKADGKA